MVRKYVRFDSYANKFYYCLVDDSDKRYNKEYGTIKEEHIPPDIVIEAKKRAGPYPSWVEIPTEDFIKPIERIDYYV